ncbi:MAG: DNA repair protein RecN [Deltaproteobacteria bacterium ADurb.Bin510]|nr:MAG: DNA repair protein RecN [Deltaproteobacteria bacterium ADurb.Bin510]
MLAIKVQQQRSEACAMVFDEIDAGISGQTAFLVAERLRTLASGSQAIVVTHLHQVAASASAHFNILKVHGSSATTSAVTKLSNDERVAELARMMGGASPSATVLDHARELLARG